MTKRNWGIPAAPGRTYPPGCDWAKPPGCACQTIAQARGCYERCDDSLTDPPPKTFPWAALAGVAAIILIVWLVASPSQPDGPCPIPDAGYHMACIHNR